MAQPHVALTWPSHMQHSHGPATCSTCPAAVTPAATRHHRSSLIAATSRHHSFDAIDDAGSYDSFRAYGQSKLANLLFARQLAERLKGQKVAVVACHPGAIDTELGRHISIPGLIKPVLKLMVR